MRQETTGAISRKGDAEFGRKWIASPPRPARCEWTAEPGRMRPRFGTLRPLRVITKSRGEGPSIQIGSTSLSPPLIPGACLLASSGPLANSGCMLRAEPVLQAPLQHLVQPSDCLPREPLWNVPAFHRSEGMEIHFRDML